MRPCYEAFSVLGPRSAAQALNGVAAARRDWLAAMPPRQAEELSREGPVGGQAPTHTKTYEMCLKKENVNHARLRSCPERAL